MSSGHDKQGWTQVNPGSGDPYLNWCRDCGAAFAVALWRDGKPPACPRCGGARLGRLSQEDT